MTSLDDFLDNLGDGQASDLFLVLGKPGRVRRAGETVLLEESGPVAGELFQNLLERLAPEQVARYQREGQLDLGYTTEKGHRFRVNLYRQQGQPALVARSLPGGSLTLEGLSLPAELARLTELSRGLVLLTGAAGSGKSTTLAALVHLLNRTRALHIATIEDPIEFVHQDQKAMVNQREVGSDAPTFEAALQNVLRQSPDVFVIGEIRDRPTMEVALASALTGHLVLATLHTGNAVQSLQRIASFFPANRRAQLHLELSQCLKALVSLRLLPARQEGRVPAVELLTVTPGVARLLREGRHEELGDVLRASQDERISSFNQALLKLYQQDRISLEVGAAFSDEPEAFCLAAGGMNTSVVGAESATAEEGARFDMRFLLERVVELGASDLHLTVDRPPMVRILGQLEPLEQDSLSAGEIRFLLYSMLNSRQRSAFEVDHELDFSLAADTGQRFRVNAFYQRGTVAVALRTIPSRIPTPTELGLPPSVVDLAARPHGLVLMVGPTGVGKTTTVACLIDLINQARPCHIITIEDPIEYSHRSQKANVNQREVYADTGSFSAALKYVLRQDPDVIVVGEMRDLETISAVLTAAETGHLVFATLHTNDVTQTIDRVVDVFPPHQQAQVRLQLAACLVGIVSQRLLPRADQEGRVAAFEVMLANSAVRALIRDGKTHQLANIVSTSSSQGMLSLDRSLAELLRGQVITSEEALKHATNPSLLGLEQRDTAEELRAANALEEAGLAARQKPGFFDVFKGGS